jgi:hypothetical protein
LQFYLFAHLLVYFSLYALKPSLASSSVFFFRQKQMGIFGRHLLKPEMAFTPILKIVHVPLMIPSATSGFPRDALELLRGGLSAKKLYACLSIADTSRSIPKPLW